MTTQMIIRLESDLKNKIHQLAKAEGKNLSELVRELLENYTKERDMSIYIDNLWGKISNKLSKNHISWENIEDAIKQVRSSNA